MQDAAGRRLDDIYTYRRDAWREAQAQTYVRRLFACFEDIAARRVARRRSLQSSASTASMSDASITTFTGVCRPMGRSGS